MKNVLLQLDCALLAEVDAQVTPKDAEIERLQEENEKLKKELTTMDENHQETVASQNNDIRSYKNQIKACKRESAACKRDIAELKAVLEATEDENAKLNDAKVNIIQANNRKIKDLTKANGKLKRQHDEDTRKIAQTVKGLEAEKAAHAETKKGLEAEKAAHAETKLSSAAQIQAFALKAQLTAWHVSHDGMTLEQFVQEVSAFAPHATVDLIFDINMLRMPDLAKTGPCLMKGTRLLLVSPQYATM